MSSDKTNVIQASFGKQKETKPSAISTITSSEIGSGNLDKNILANISSVSPNLNTHNDMIALCRAAAIRGCSKAGVDYETTMKILAYMPTAN